ncbi:lipase [Amycolatopsis cynarae]|uniref:Lipase n=1 Tax=Amycolatopsis cynarae TaxID=2995223 RepID=A0ABY7BCV8_9PSEU|nr:lipase [Amycolatopsis sp. HUAS 11-8]WAL68731.1 lipase [Amycolatopsis sp. HUAS 11-8]
MRLSPALAAVAALIVACASSVAAAPAATAATTPAALAFAPIDRPGPALSVPAEQLAKSVTCTASARNATREVVLFVPGTTVTPREDFGWSWFPALDKLNWPYCSVTEPDNAMSDAQISAEYVVHAIRYVHQLSGRKVDIIGHSQGGTEPRFALRFWPDLRSIVDDYIALGATNHGSVVVDAMCPPVAGCAPALWQQTYNSHYIQAMNSVQETFPGISYTDIYTRTDEFVQPNLDDHGTTSLHGGGGAITNVAIQDVCPLDLASEHLAVGIYDPTAYAIAMDALTHAGPADPARVSRAACAQLFMTGVDPVTFATDYASSAAVVAKELALHPHVAAEPPLASYVYADNS